MRTASDLRERWLESVPQIIRRPGMYARDGREMETVAGRLLQDLCFLDDREADYERIREELRRYGELGVHGPFHALFESVQGCQAEVASVYAEVFHRLGYLVVGRLIDAVQWRELAAGLRNRFEDIDVRRSEAEGFLGPASLVVDKRVLCYAAEDSSAGWLFVDCWAETTRTYQPGHGTYTAAKDADPLVRAVRAPASDFDSGLILTLYGKVLRWGPGWWIDHPSRNASPESLAIAEQLRQIHAGDPSQDFL